MKRILVIGGTGRVGREVLCQLPEGVRVRALARDPERAGLPPQVEVVRGDLNVPESLDDCLDGIDTVFLVWCAPATAVGPAMERILPRTQRIVFLSAPHKTPHPFFQQPNPMAAMQVGIERAIEASGTEWTFLRPGMFAANVRGWWAAQILGGSEVVRWPYAEVPTAPIDERDIAAVAVRALCNDGHTGAEYVLTGPQSLTQREQLSTIGDVIGRPLRMQEISPDEARHELLTIIPAVSIVNMLLNAWGAAAGQAALVTSTVAEITGAPARSFRSWVTDHAVDLLRRAQSKPGQFSLSSPRRHTEWQPPTGRTLLLRECRIRIRRGKVCTSESRHRGERLLTWFCLAASELKRHFPTIGNYR